MPSNNESSRISTNQLWIWDCVYFGDLDDRNIVHDALKEVAKKFVYQLEKAPTTGAKHYQIYLNLKRKQRSGELGSLLSGLGLKGITCRPASNAGKVALTRYCMKNESRIAGPFADHQIYMGQDLIKKLRPWQKVICDLSEEPPHPRQIQWFYDAKGGKGKTSLSKYMYYHKQILTLTIGRASDILNLVFKLPPQNMYIFDISRTVSASSMHELYQSIEMVKNGYFVNTKYDTGVHLASIPHVIVFSNHLPKCGALSLDRWKIIDMDTIPSEE